MPLHPYSLPCQIPVDLRKTLASSILVAGGTAMLPGLIPRLHNEILKAVSTPPPPRPASPRKAKRPPPPQYDKYATLRPLVPYFAILNNPTPGKVHSERARANAGRAPSFAPAMLPWVGGSLAGALKTGGSEVHREHWDQVGEGAEAEGDDDAMDISELSTPKKASALIPDWTRSPMKYGAPSAAKGTSTSA